MTKRRPPGIESYRPGSENGGPPGAPHQHAQPRRRGHRPVSRKPARKRSTGIGSIILYFFVGLLALIGAGLAVLFVAPPTDLIRDQLIAQVKSSTGRDLKITGGTGISFYPGIGFSMAGVSLSPPPGMAGPSFVQMKALTVQVKLLPLLSRTVSVDQFILEDPVFDFRVDGEGRKSWDFASAGDFGGGKVRLAQAAGSTRNDASSPGGSSGSVSMAALEQLELGDVRIINGKVRYTDAVESAHEAIDAINVTLALKSLNEPLNASGNLNYRKDKIDFEAVVKSLKEIMTNAPAGLNANLRSAKFAANYGGSIDVSGDLRLDGDIALSTQSVRKLAGWLGAALPPATGFGPLDLKGFLNASGPNIKLSKLDMNLDGASAKGTIAADASGARPIVTANLNVSELDLNKYLPPSGAGSRASNTGANTAQPDQKTSGQQKAGSRPAPASIEDLIGEPGPRVKGYSKREGWSTDPIDVTPLASLDADVDLTLGKLLYENIKVGRSKLVVSLKNRALTAKLDEMALYSGVGRGEFILNARTNQPRFSANFNLTGVEAQPLLTDAAEIDWLAGKGQLLFSVTSIGNNEKTIISKLGGTAKFNFQDGAIVGVNIPKYYRAIKGLLDGGLQTALQQGQLPTLDLKSGPTEQTDFSELSATFNIENGVANNKDLKMLSPLLTLTGEGDVLLPARRVDYLARPRVVRSLDGQGRKESAAGIEVPMHCHGPFEKVKCDPKLDDALKQLAADPSKAVEAVRKIGGEKAGKVLDQLLGSDGNGASKAKQLLDGLFKKP